MSILKYTALALAVGASVSMTTPAQAQSRTYVVEGTVNESTFDWESGDDLWLIDNIEDIVGFRMIVTYDDSLMFYDTDSYWDEEESIFYEDSDAAGMAFTALRFEFLDSDGNVVEQSQIPMVPDVQTPVIDEFDFEFNQDLDLEEGGEVYDEDLDVEFDFVENGTLDWWPCEPVSPMQPCTFHALDFDIDTDRGDAPLFTHDGTRLEPVTYLGTANFEGNFYYWQEVNYGEGYDYAEIDLYFDIHSIYFDADLDGVADELDSCDASVTGGTVTFGEYDSGVENVMASNGCTVMDSYLACDAGGQSMYGGPTYCEMQVAYSLYRDGTVDYSDVRTLRTALYNAYRSGAMR
ncbi:hypothetical protein CWI80_09245 [Pseudidiomarina sediminum]|uniref:EF-hand domain-containing protein n=1 Tax=Pseudidiomarina sediminum TaxID=431675 RepID=A0A432Z497_9GAMM|nr:hypothetical protein [Pseudidiomarina sediminum]RUO72716.1 hypothetical protein CWI80_09245 [Pseudidiomarina sediminum]